MIALVIRYQVKPDRVDDFIAACRDNAKGTHHHDGALRFDLVQDDGDPTRFALVELYPDDASKDAHLASDHFQAWVAATRDLHAAPPELVKGTPVFAAGVDGLDLG